MRRSNEANARYWALLHEISEKVKVNNKQQRYYPVNVWHEYFKSRFIGCDEMMLPNRHSLILPISTTTLDKAQFGNYMTQVEAWAAERGIYLEDLESA
jgi:hypothetical protein